MSASIPPELMALLKGGQSSGGPAPVPGQPPGGQPPPVSSPMSTPQENAGEKENAMVQVQMAMDLLEQSLPAFGSESEEGATVLQVLSGLNKKFGSKREKGRELIPSEIMNLISTLPQGPMGAKPGAGGGMPPGMPKPPGVNGPGAIPPA